MELGLMEIVKAVHAIDYTARDRDQVITGVEFDTRIVGKGDLFIPLTGGRTDGHEYVAQAVENGASAVLWSNDPEEAPSDKVAVIFVDDTTKAMQMLAHYYRKIVDPIVVGITGSNGKTTTKDMTAQALTAKYKVHKTYGNYNNEIGLPYTILTMPSDTEVLVCEMGMTGRGEIEELARISEPDIAAITLIGESHLEHLGSRSEIAKTKLEITHAFGPENVLIYPADEPLIQDEIENLNCKKISFGISQEPDVYAYDIVEEPDSTYFVTNLDSNVTCMIPVIGSYNVTNALIALAVARELEVPMEQAIFQLSQFELTSNRLEWREGRNGAKILNDAYNASPTSMKALLETISNLEVEGVERKVLVLGDILELGEKSSEYHSQLADYIDPGKFDRVYLFGQEMGALFYNLLFKFEEGTLFYEIGDHEILIEQLKEDIKPTDLVVLKSSFGTDLLKVVKAISK